MAANIQVVLREDVNKLGKTGEIVKVKPGYARNFLVPRGLAVIATDSNVRQVEHVRKIAFARAAKLRAEAEAKATKLNEVVIHIAKQVGDEEKLYGSVTTKEIADALAAKGFEVDKKTIQLDTVRKLGTYDVGIKLSPDVTAKIKLEVKAKA